MKPLALGSLLFLLVASSPAQVTVEIAFDQEQVLRNESLPVRVRIVNFSGRALQLGGSPDWLSFVVEGAAREPLPRLSALPETDVVEVENSKVGVVRVDLMPHYDLGVPGAYRLTASVRMPGVADPVQSKPALFEVVGGTTLWEKEFGLPSPDRSEIRKYAIQQATFLKHLRLYVRLTTPDDSKVFKVVPLGPMVSFARPEAQMDKLSNLHTLFQNGPRSFLYQIVTPDGELILRQTYEYTQSRPKLDRRQDTLGVSGGVRLFYSTDIPPSEPVPILPPSTNAPAAGGAIPSTNAPALSPAPAAVAAPANKEPSTFVTPKIKRTD